MALESYYKIAGLNVRISGGMNLYGFSEFRVAELSNLDVDIVCDSESLGADAAASRELNRFVVDDVSHIFSRYQGGYLFTLQKENQQVSLRYEKGATTVHIERCDDAQLLRFMLWVAYSLVALGRGVIPIHSSAIIHNESVVLFLGESGAGKSTQSALWVEYIESSRLLNDDSPILRFEGDYLKAYGSPWSGKKACYINESYRVKAFVRVVKAAHNKIHKSDIIHSLAAIYPSLPPMFATEGSLSDEMLKFISQLLLVAPAYTLQCTKEVAAAEITHNELYGKRDNK